MFDIYPVDKPVFTLEPVEKIEFDFYPADKSPLTILRVRGGGSVSFGIGDMVINYNFVVQ